MSCPAGKRRIAGGGWKRVVLPLMMMGAALSAWGGNIPEAARPADDGALSTPSEVRTASSPPVGKPAAPEGYAESGKVAVYRVKSEEATGTAAVSVTTARDARDVIETEVPPPY